jgi:hypothetical protein
MPFKPVILKARRSKLISQQLRVQFDTEEMKLVKAFLKYQCNVETLDELAEGSILELIKRDSPFMKKYNNGDYDSEVKEVVGLDKDSKTVKADVKADVQV